MSDISLPAVAAGISPAERHRDTGALAGVASTMALATQVLREQNTVTDVSITTARIALLVVPEATDAWLVEIDADGRCRPVIAETPPEPDAPVPGRPDDPSVIELAVAAARSGRIICTGSVLAAPLLLCQQRVGRSTVLVLTGPDGALNDTASDAVGMLVVHVGAVLDGHRSRQRVLNLEEALATNRVIGTAIGQLMARYSLGQDDAFDVLKRLSQDSNRKLRDLAEQIVAGTL